MSRPRITFDAKLETLAAEATPEQLTRMRDLAAMLLRIQSKQGKNNADATAQT